jgi:predicted nuclease of restriction endonuclease-like (RecB) superfamily
LNNDTLLFSYQQARKIQTYQMVFLKPLSIREATHTKRSNQPLNQVNQLVITRNPKMCNFLDYKDYKIVYKRFASLYFITIVDKDHNELIVL